MAPNLNAGYSCVALVISGLLSGCLLTDGLANGNIFKVALTQKGYIQFLRYQVTVPDLRDFTSCIWIKSSNTTHAQSILSYSKHESQRLIRLWISPRGQHVHLELFGQHVMSAHVAITPGRWYHLCQAWSSVDGLWGFYMNSVLVAMGTIKDRKLRGRKIPGGGDVVIGQEYTDFDKGLEDGVEGEIFGFNLLANSQYPLHAPKPKSLRPPSTGHHKHPHASYIGHPRHTSHPYHTSHPHHTPVFIRRQQVERYRRKRSARRRTFLAHPEKKWKQSRSGADFVRQCYRYCAAGRGTPTKSLHVLIAWARTPVRVFGGAVMKNAHPVCAAF